jgi:two-component system sensor histidine kinase BaeS
MFSSLRFRLPAFFLAGVVIAGLISTVVASRLFQQHIRSQNLSQLKREARGLTELYAQQAIRSSDEGRSAPDFAAAELEKATGARLFYVGVPIFPGQASGLRELPQSAVDWDALQDGKVITFDFTPPGEHKSFLAVGQPLQLAGGKSPTFGGLIVAKPKTELTHGWIALVELLFLALGIGLVVSTILAWYLSRRISDPVLALAKAADQVAEGNYDVEVPAAGSDEVGHLAERFKQMASRLAEAEVQERNFLMSVSHELRTPLTAIRGHADALREGLVEDPESRAASLDVIAAEADRLERLVGDVLDLAKLDAHRFTVLKEEVDMARLVDEVYAAFGEEARRRGIDYECDAAEGPVIVTDGDRVFQIVSNLVSNAFRWTPDGGRVSLALAQDNGTISVSVADTGPGIKPNEQERIFRPFWSRDGAGTGLGLAIARELAVALGGRIELESEPGAGSRFDLLLPATPPS